MTRTAHETLGSQALDALLDELAERVARKLAERSGREAPRYADARNNPLRSARAFLDAARRGDFPSFKRGREVVAHWAEVERHIERRRRRVTSTAELDDDRALLERAGVRLRRAASHDTSSEAPPTLDRIARRRA